MSKDSLRRYDSALELIEGLFLAAGTPLLALPSSTQAANWRRYAMNIDEGLNDTGKLHNLHGDKPERSIKTYLM